MSKRFASASSQYIELGSAVLTTFPLTLAAWVFPTVLSGQKAVLTLSNTASSTSILAGIAFNNSTPLLYVANSSNSAATIPAQTNSWQHLAGVFNSTSARSAYINGKSQSFSTTVAQTTPNCTEIGCKRMSTGRGQFFDGLIAEAAIWNVALTDAEVCLLAQGELPSNVRPSAIVGYWPLTGGQVGTVLEFDAAPFAPRRNDMTINGPTPGSHLGLMRSPRRPRRFAPASSLLISSHYYRLLGSN